MRVYRKALNTLIRLDNKGQKLVRKHSEVCCKLDQVMHDLQGVQLNGTEDSIYTAYVHTRNYVHLDSERKQIDYQSKLVADKAMKIMRNLQG